MNLYEWKEDYSVDIKSIDHDHQGIFKIINDLFNAISHGKAKDTLAEFLAHLADYTKTHFKREEMYFLATNYPETLEHKLQHEFFIDKIDSLKKQFESGDKQISVELMQFLSEWLINHILISDKKYMNHLKKFKVE